ncbi:RasGEF [Tyrophagus putrescentiae]|nr:RasGEF [Tyrophagus putrescentiae]
MAGQSKLRPQQQQQQPNRPPPSKLPELCLLAIFSQMDLVDRFSALAVCPRWHYRVREINAQTVRSLTITVAYKNFDEPLSHFQHVVNFYLVSGNKSVQLLTKVVDKVTGKEEQEFLIRLTKFNCLNFKDGELKSLERIRQIVSFYGGIIELTFVVYSKFDELKNLIKLLEEENGFWQKRLQKLYIVNWDHSERPFWQEMFKIINSMSSLQRLSIVGIDELPNKTVDASFKVNEDSKSESQIFPKRNSTQTFPSGANLKPLIKVSPEEVAKQLTLIDWSIFSSITRIELRPGQWTSSMKHILSPNVVDFTRRFNILTFWISDEVLGMKQPKQRAGVISYFIRVAHHLIDLKNLVPLHRLKKTWAYISKKNKQMFDKIGEHSRTPSQQQTTATSQVPTMEETVAERTLRQFVSHLPNGTQALDSNRRLAQSLQMYLNIYSQTPSFSQEGNQLFLPRISIANEIANLEINRVDGVKRLQKAVSEMYEQSVMTLEEPTEENHQKLQYTTARMKAHLNLFHEMINNLSEQFAKFETNQRSVQQKDAAFGLTLLVAQALYSPTELTVIEPKKKNAVNSVLAAELSNSSHPNFVQCVLKNTKSYLTPLKNYKLTGEFGKGAQGIVYKAKLAGDSADRLVALKVETLNGCSIQGVIGEVSFTSPKLLSHPNILNSEHCSIFQIFEHPNKYYMALAFQPMEDGSLALYWRDHWPERYIACVMKQVLKGFAYIHSMGIVHNDVKPGNILLHNGNVKIADFGKARNLANLGRVTKGTRRYTSPEMARASLNGDRKCEDFSAAVDIWALGATLYQLLECHFPYEDANYDTVLEAISNQGLKLSDNESYSVEVKTFFSLTASQVDDEVEKVGDQQSLGNPHLLTVPTEVRWICRLELAPHFVVHHYGVIHRKEGIVGEKLSVVQLGRNNSLTVFDVPTAEVVHVPMQSFLDRSETS